MTEIIVLEGYVENVIYYNPENAYTIFSISCKIENNTENIVCIAYIPSLNQGENLKLTGKYVLHPTYGKQLSVDTYEKSIPTTKDQIEKYLSSGVIKGIGEVLAKRITNEFGDETLKIIESYPEKLAKLKGISLDKAKNISSIFNEQIELRKVILYLQKYDISPLNSIKIFKKYKNNTVNVVEQNPYALSDDIFGVGFKTADKIAFKIGIEKDSNFRIKAGIKYCLMQETTNGHVCLPKDILIKNVSELLQIDISLVDNVILELQLEKIIIQDKINDNNIVYIKSFYYAENYIAKKLLQLSEKNNLDNEFIDQKIKKVQNETGIILAENQKQAVRESLLNNVLVITGGPGTGKTTIINIIIKILCDEGYEIELAAPTGRAAKRMSESTKRNAKTIHRLLGIKFLSDNSSRQVFEKNEENPIETDLIIVDETSMIDTMLMFYMLKAITDGTRLILVGDVDQLPSVGPGNILKDIINSNLIAVVYLKEVFRQVQESAIIMNAHKINKGIYPILNEKGKDFFFLNRKLSDEIIDTLLELVVKRIPKYLNCDKIQDIQIITPMRKSSLGVQNLNELLQEKLNPKCKDKIEYTYRKITFREGDKVMQIKNNYNMPWCLYNDKGIQIDEGIGVFNGDEGIIRKIVESKELVKIEFYDGKIVNYDFTQLDELELSYAITIHKAQGSEYKVVILPIYNGPLMLLSRNLLYTAVTRGKELVILVGIKEVLYKMIDNNRELNRYSFLGYRIKKLSAYLS